MAKENKNARWIIGIPFLIVGFFVVFGKSFLNRIQVDPNVLTMANLLLFFIGYISLSLQQRSLNNPNPNSWVRVMMLSALLKLVVLGAALLIYLTNAGANKNKRSIFIAMGLYLIYAWLEVRIGLRMKKKSDARN